MTAIRITDLVKQFRGVTAVDHLTLSVEQGETFALLGVNGAGKTTALRMLACLTRPTAGDALLMGKSILTQPGEVKKSINLSPQETAVAPNLTARENLELMAGVYGFSRSQARSMAGEMIERLSLQEVAGRRAKTLSGGWQRRLSIAMALITNPQILFLDEPTLGLDVLARRQLWSVIAGLKGKVTTILTTHYLEEAETLADRIGIMVRGSVLALGTAAELKAQTGTTSLEDAFVALAEEGAETI